MTRSPAHECAADVKWLSADEIATWMEVRRLLLLLPSALDSAMTEQAGISFFEYQVLATLSEHPEATLRMSELASSTSSSLSRLSHAIARLEHRGLVARRRCGGVGRSSVAVLTAKGRAKLEASAPGHVASVRALVIDSLSASQVRSLRSIARRIVERLAIEGRDEP